MSRRQLVIMLGVLAAVGAFRLATIREGHPWGGDFAQYLHHAENIARGHPYAETGYVYNEHWPDLGPPRYPPGLPLLLAMVYSGPESGLSGAKLLMNALSIAMCAVIALVYSRGLAFASRVALTALVGLSPVTWAIKDHIISEHAFMPVFLVALVMCDRLWRLDRGGERRMRLAVVTGVVAYVAYACRTIGFLVVPALGLAALVRTRRLGKLTVTCAATALVLAAVQGALLPGGVGYLDQLGITAGQAATNLTVYARGFTYYFGGGSHVLLRQSTAILFGVFASLGYARRWRDGRVGTAETFVILYVLVLLTWRAAQGTRFLLPIVPLILRWALEAIERCGRRAGLVLGAVCALACASFVLEYAGTDMKRIEGGLGSPGVAETFEYVRGHTRPDAVLVFRKPRVLAHYCRRRAATLHDAPLAEQWSFLEGIGATHVVVRDVDEPWVFAFVDASAPRLTEVFHSGVLRVFEVRRP